MAEERTILLRTGTFAVRGVARAIIFAANENDEDMEADETPEVRVDLVLETSEGEVVSVGVDPRVVDILIRLSEQEAQVAFFQSEDNALRYTNVDDSIDNAFLRRDDDSPSLGEEWVIRADGESTSVERDGEMYYLPDDDSGDDDDDERDLEDMFTYEHILGFEQESGS